MEIESFKISTYMQNLLVKFCGENKISKSDFFRKCLINGLKSEKLSQDLTEMLKYAELEEKFSEGDFKIRMTLKKASLVENYKKLLTSLANRRMSTDDYNDVRDSLLDRIKKVFGENSKEYKYCMRLGLSEWGVKWTIQ